MREGLLYSGPMLVGKGRAALLGGVAIAAVMSTASRASAQEPAPGFGRRDAFVFSVERIFGYQSQTFGSQTVDSTGYHPLYWSGLGFHGVMSSGLTVGALVGATFLSLKQADTNATAEKATLIWLRPRIGYAGTLQNHFGYWIRGGPTVLFSIDHESGDTHDAFSFGGEAYAVFELAPHVDLMFGPHVEFKLAADEDDNKYASVGLTFGLMGEFY